jgi:hypothetical protein
MPKVVVAVTAVAVLLVCGARSQLSPPQELEQRGCCSHHHGVCGCSSGRTLCCDQSLSPSCRC